MNGHLEIIALRKRKVKPEFVFLNDYECQTDWFETGDHVTISLTNKDIPETLDLRFLVGTTVSISTESENRARRLLEACKRAGCSTVAVAVTDSSKKPWDQDGYMEVWRNG